MPGRMSQLKPSPSMAVSQAAMAPAGDTRYSATGGAPRTMSAVIEKFRRENGLEFSADEVDVANGAKQIIFNALMATLEEGDEQRTEALPPVPHRLVANVDTALVQQIFDLSQ